MTNSSDQRSQAISTSPALVPEFGKVPHFGPAPLLEGENASAYNDLSAAVFGRLKPADIIEEMWTKDVVDLIWEHQRWRRYRENYINSEVSADLAKVLNPLIDLYALHPGSSFMAQCERAAAKLTNAPGEDLVRRWAAGEADAITQVNDLLASAKMSMDTVVARTAARLLETIGGFNRLISSAEWRRDALLREIMRRREAFALRVRDELAGVGAPSATKTIDAQVTQPNESAA